VNAGGESEGINVMKGQGMKKRVAVAVLVLWAGISGPTCFG